MIGGYDTAVAKMNAKAASIGAIHTHATTPSGLDGPGGSGLTTPRDLAIIFRAAMANPTFAQITAQPVAMFPTDAGEKPLVNDDELLHRYPGAIGGKTGFTDAAKKTFGRRRGPRRTSTGDRDDVRADQRRRPDLLGSSQLAARLGFCSRPKGRHRLTLSC